MNTGGALICCILCGPGMVQVPEVVDGLLARSHSVGDYSVSVRFARAERLEDFMGRCRSELGMALSVGGAQARKMLQSLCATAFEESVAWPSSEVLSRGDAFKSIEYSPDQKPYVIQQYDKRRYVHYLPAQSVPQMDVFRRPEDYRTVRYDFEYLNVTVDKLSRYPIISAHSTESGVDVVQFGIENGNEGAAGAIKKTVTVEIDARGRIQHLLVTRNGGLFGERWFFNYADVDGIPVPGTVVSIRDDAIEWVELVEAAVNQGIDDEQLQIEDIPPHTTVVDHIFGKPAVAKAAELPPPALKALQGFGAVDAEMEEYGETISLLARNRKHSTPIPYEDIHSSEVIHVEEPAPPRQEENRANAHPWIWMVATVIGAGIGVGLVLLLMRRRTS